MDKKISEDTLVRLTEEKIQQLTLRNQINDFPCIEGKVERIFSPESIPILSIIFDGQKRTLPITDVERI